MEIFKHNQDNWELKVKQKNQWTIPVSSERTVLLRQEP